MKHQQLLPFLVAALLATLWPEPTRVSSQRGPPCANAPTAGKTDKQIKLESCSCEQAAAQDKPAYRVGAAPFGRDIVLRVGTRTRRGRTVEPQNLYAGLEVPNLRDLHSPAVVGLREKVLSAREEAWQQVAKSWQSIYRQSFVREIERRGYFNRLNEFFSAEPLKGNPEDYLKPEVYTALLAYLREHGQQFASLEREHQRLKQIRDLNDRGPALPRFDWREQGLNVGAVMNQGACQSCWAFTAVSVYQSTWNLEQIRTGKYFSDVLDSVEPYGLLDRFASVQQLLNCIGKEKGNCESGGWHGTAFAFMVGSHVPHVSDRVVERRLSTIDKIEAEGYTGKLARCVNPFRQTVVRRGGRTIVLDNAGTAAVRLQTGTNSKTNVSST